MDEIRDAKKIFIRFFFKSDDLEDIDGDKHGDIKTYLRHLDCEGVRWLQSAQNCVQWRPSILAAVILVFCY
jgi:hypothetical protein